MNTLRGSYAWPWSDLTEQQRTTRLDRVLDHAEDFIYVATRDSYRTVGCVEESPDWCSADAVEARRKYRDAHR